MRRNVSTSSKPRKQAGRERPRLGVEWLEDRSLLDGGGLTDPNLVVTPAPLPLQPVGVPFVDPTFGTTLRRVSDTSAHSGFETQIYSQLQAFSSDDQYLLLTGSNGYVVRRVSDLSVVSGLDTSGWNAPRWHPTQPHTIIHFDSNADTTVRIQFTDVDTGVTTDVFTFPAQYQYVMNNQSFDEISEDGRWLAGMVRRNDGQGVIFSFNLEQRRLGAVVPIHDLFTGRCQPDPQWGEIWPDWVGVSPLGRYLVVGWARDGTAPCSGVETWDFETGAFVGRVNDGHQHGDLGVMPDGTTEYYMTFEVYGSPADHNRPAIGLRLLPGNALVSEPTYLQSIDWGNAEHISARGPNGVALITSGADPSNGWTNFEGEVWLQYTDGRVLRLAHHRSSSCGYWVQPRATISRDGRFVAFASDWSYGTGTDSCRGGNDLGAGDPYIIDLAGGSPPPQKSADLSVVESHRPDPAVLGRALTFTLTVTNQGPSIASQVTLTDNLLGRFRLLSASASQGACSGTRTIRCNLGDVAAGSVATVTIVVAPQRAAAITADVRISSDVPDPDSTNNSLTETILVSRRPVSVARARRR